MFTPREPKIVFDGTAPLTVSMYNSESIRIETTDRTGLKHDNVLTRAEALMLGDVLIRMAEAA